MKKMLASLICSFLVMSTSVHSQGKETAKVESKRKGTPLETIELALKEVNEGTQTRIEISKKYGVSRYTILRWIRNYNKKKYPFEIGTDRIKILATSYSIDFIKRVLEETSDGLTTREEILRKYCICQHTLLKWMRAYNAEKYPFMLKIKKFRIRPIRTFEENLIKDILEEASQSQMRQKDILEKYNVGLSHLNRWINAYNAGKYSFTLQVPKIIMKDVYELRQEEDLLLLENMIQVTDYISTTLDNEK